MTVQANHRNRCDRMLSQCCRFAEVLRCDQRETHSRSEIKNILFLCSVEAAPEKLEHKGGSKETGARARTSWRGVRVHIGMLFGTCSSELQRNWSDRTHNLSRSSHRYRMVRVVPKKNAFLGLVHPRSSHPSPVCAARTHKSTKDSFIFFSFLAERDLPWHPGKYHIAPTWATPPTTPLDAFRRCHKERPQQVP